MLNLKKLRKPFFVKFSADNNRFTFLNLSGWPCSSRKLQGGFCGKGRSPLLLHSCLFGSTRPVIGLHLESTDLKIFQSCQNNFFSFINVLHLWMTLQIETIQTEKKSSSAPAPPSLVANWNNFPSRLDRCNRLIVGYSFAHFCRPRQKYDTNIPTPFPLPTSNTTTTSYKEKEYLITFRVGTFSLNSSTTFFSWPPWHWRGSPFWWQCKPSPSSKHAEWQTWTVVALREGFK